MTEPRGIVLIEDNPDDELLAIRALRRHGITEEIRSFSNGMDVLEFLFAEGPWQNREPPLPRFVLLDLKLPGMNGHEILRRLRAHPRTRRVPVIVLSTSSMPEDIGQSYDLGANSYIRKAIDYEEFNRHFAILGQYWLEMNLAP